MQSRSYWYCGWTTTLNIILNGLTFGRYLWLEGRVTDGFFHNWAHRFRYKPQQYALPTTEQEIIDLITRSSSVRLFGAGHSFNSGVESDYALISLDNYKGIVPGSENTEKMQLTVRAGTRMRDVIQLLLDRGWAFKALPSHNAQSIGGILATDVHGTGKNWGWVSEMVVSLKVIDGKGDVYVVKPEDELFRSAIGGIGAVGIITEVTVQARVRFNMLQICEMADLRWVEEHLEEIIQANDHMSLYIFPFSTRVQINKWNHTDKPQSFLGSLREWINISADALVSAWLGNLMAYGGTLNKLAPIVYWFKKMTTLVLESAEAYSRTIYHLHQEQEFTVPQEEAIPMCKLFLETFENMYLANPKHNLPYTLLEIRFTPAGHELALIGPGRDTRRCWIDIVCNDTHGFEKYYAAAEEIIKKINARPHLGKFCETLDKQHLQEIYGAHFERFLELRNEHDPERKFINPFTRRLFGD
jgi:FAD/FMN-containing dehydrogenase